MIKNIIFDWKRTLYDPDTKELIAGALDVLEKIKDMGVLAVLIGKGGEDMSLEVDRLNVRGYFQDIVFAQGDKDPNVFAKYISKEKPEDTFIIGDRVRSELEIGNVLGATTIWVKQGKFASELPENDGQQPDYTVSSLAEALKILLSIF